MNVLFFGSPQFALPTLQSLINAEDIHVEAVVTQPDKPAGRGKLLTPPPVKKVAEKHGIVVHQPRSIRKKRFTEWCRAFDADYFVVVAYGKILPKKVLEIPKYGCVNLHASLLPKYRGAAPIAWALVEGETVTGISTMLMDEGMDTGPVLLEEKISIGDRETTDQMSVRMAERGGPLVLKTLRDYMNNQIKPHQQDHAAATHAPLISKEDGKIDWNLSAKEIENRWRGFTPWPGIYAQFRNEIIKLKEVITRDGIVPDAIPGSIMIESGQLMVVCGNGTILEILKAQLPGKKPLPATDLINGARIATGELFL